MIQPASSRNMYYGPINRAAQPQWYQLHVVPADQITSSRGVGGRLCTFYDFYRSEIFVLCTLCC